MGRRIALAVFSVSMLEGLYITAFNFSKNSVMGLVAMYLLVLIPLIGGAWLLHPSSEPAQQKLIRLLQRRRILP
jgi:hypothetical protein